MENNFLLNSKILELFKDISKLIVSCSGGADSTALLHAIYYLSKQNRAPKPVVFHVNYHLRGKESDGDANFVQNLCNDLGLEIVLHNAWPGKELDNKGDPPSPSKSSGIQLWARSVREKAFQDFIKKGFFICTAHHFDDQTENLLFRMGRGASFQNIFGMSAVNGKMLKPFLERRKSEILSFLQQNNLPYRKDSSNDKIDYSRNKIRHQVMPVLAALNDRYEEKIHRLFLVGESLENKYIQDVKRICSQCKRNEGKIFLSLGSIEKPLRIFWMREALQLLNGNPALITRSHEDKVDYWLENLGDESSPVLDLELQPGCYLVVEKDSIALRLGQRGIKSQRFKQHLKLLWRRPQSMFVGEQDRVLLSDTRMLGKYTDQENGNFNKQQNLINFESE